MVRKKPTQASICRARITTLSLYMSLSDRNLPLYDFAEDTGRAFIAMEFLEGDTLSVRIKQGPLQIEEAAKIAIAIANALSAAHRKGIIHRDLKPGNVMLTDTGAKLLDFGLAKSEPLSPGPATWVQGEYPPGQDDLPVTRVSWFEAAAYAKFVGKSLSTLYHWIAAASPLDGATIIPASNFGGQGPAARGVYPGMSWSGVYDLAGNVKEWTLNQADSGKRYILGGAWNEPIYMFYDADARSSFERSANFGFRCAKYSLNGESAKAADPVANPPGNYGLSPARDQVFRVYKSLYSYDKTALNAKVESVSETDHWKQEKITFAAAYGDERVIAFLYIPKKGTPPFQTLVYFPGAGAVRTRSSANLSPGYLDDFDFIVKGGRAVMFPLYKATFERGDGMNNVWPTTTSSYRDHVIAWSKDLGRSIDYLETRSDIDHNKLAYEGYSWGAAMRSLLPAMEDRIKVLVLIAPGFYLQRRLPEVDQINFAPRVKAPVLMLNGRFDFIFPTGSSQEPMFRQLGTPPEHKRRVLYDTGHDIPRTEMIKETLNWLDRYLGPVK